MSGVTNTGVVGYVSNPVASFPRNSITVDIFGNSFYRGYEYGAGDDTGAYWNETLSYSSKVLLFISATINKSLYGLFSYGNKLRSSRSYDITVKLPTKNGEIDFDFIEEFVAELEATRLAELEAYLEATGLRDYTLTPHEIEALAQFESIAWEPRKVTDLFLVRNTRSILAQQVVADSGSIPYVGAGVSNNSVITNIEFDPRMIEEGNCVFIGGKTFVVTYQHKDFFSNDSHNLALYLKEGSRTLYNQLFLATCIYRSLAHKYTWGDSISRSKIEKDYILVPVLSDGKNAFAFMESFIRAIQKLVIKDVVQYLDRKIAATKEAIATHL